MSVSKMLLLLIYVSLFGSSVYNLKSFIPKYEMGAEITQEYAGYQICFRVYNSSPVDWEDTSIVLNDFYVVHYDRVKKKEIKNICSVDFLPIEYRPYGASWVNIAPRILQGDLVNKIIKEIEQKAEIKIYKKGGYYFQKLQ